MAQRAFGKGKATRVFLALLLAFSLVGIGAVPAAADPADDTQAAVDAAQATLDEAESRMAQINSEYEQLTAEVAELQTKIDETAAAAMEAQQAMLEGRAALGQVAVGEYRDGSSMGLLGLILDSKNFDELLRNMEYVTQIMSYQADEVAEQKERKRAIDDVSDELNAQKNEQEEALAAQEAKRAEAQSVVKDAAARLEGAQEEHAARLAELAAQAEALRKQEEEAAAACRDLFQALVQQLFCSYAQQLRLFYLFFCKFFFEPGYQPVSSVNLDFRVVPARDHGWIRRNKPLRF